MLKLRSGILGLTLTSVIALASANAADMYRGEGGSLKDGPVYIPVQTWTGFYAGVNGGYARSANSDNIRYSTTAGTLVNNAGGYDAHGGFGGGQIGYNFQSGMLGFGPRFVFGVEADFQGAGIESKFRQAPAAGSVLETLITSAGTVNGSQNIDWFGTVRGRLGYAFDRTLIYATGGFAYANVEDSVVIRAPGGAVGASYRNNDTQTGYVVGGGIEYAVSPSWSVKAEYQYINLGDEKLSGSTLVPLGPVPAGTALTTNDLTNDFHTVRAGINYHMSRPYEPLK